VFLATPALILCKEKVGVFYIYKDEKDSAAAVGREWNLPLPLGLL